MNGLQILGTVGVTHFMDPGSNAIGWCGRTVNLFRGCSPISEGCRFCYAMAEGGHQIVMRATSPYRNLVRWLNGAWRWTGVVEPTGTRVWTSPFGTRQRWLIFANSMSDLFHERLCEEAILFALRVIWRARAHQWQVLSKRAGRMANIISRLHMVEGELQLAPLPLVPEQRYVIKNLWLGVSVENQAMADERLPHLAATHAAVRFVSFEPLLGPIDLSRHTGAFDWAIVGGESATEFRPMEDDWVRAIRDFCVANSLPFFFKQRAGVKPAHAPALDGATWAQLPRVELLELPSDSERHASALWVSREYARVFAGVEQLTHVPNASELSEMRR